MGICRYFQRGNRMRFIYYWNKPEGIEFSTNRELANKILHSGHMVKMIPIEESNTL